MLPLHHRIIVEDGDVSSHELAGEDSRVLMDRWVVDYHCRLTPGGAAINAFGVAIDFAGTGAGCSFCPRGWS